MEFRQITASIRNRTGKGPARRLRNLGLTPSVLYGTKMDTISLAVSPKELIKALSGPFRTNTVLTLNIEGQESKSKVTYNAIVKNHQYDPVSRKLLHVDFVAVDLENKIKVNVPLKTVGRAIGVQAGGVLTIVCRSLPVECLPSDIPEAITVDVSEIEIHGSLPVGKIKMPEGIDVLLPPETAVVMVQTTRVEQETVAEGEGEAVTEGEGEGATDGEKSATEEKHKTS